MLIDTAHRPRETGAVGTLRLLIPAVLPGEGILIDSAREDVPAVAVSIPRVDVVASLRGSMKVAPIVASHPGAAVEDSAGIIGHQCLPAVIYKIVPDDLAAGGCLQINPTLLLLIVFSFSEALAAEPK